MLFRVVVSLAYKTISILWTEHLGSVHFILCQLHSVYSSDLGVFGHLILRCTLLAPWLATDSSAMMSGALWEPALLSAREIQGQMGVGVPIWAALQNEGWGATLQAGRSEGHSAGILRSFCWDWVANGKTRPCVPVFPGKTFIPSLYTCFLWTYSHIN